MNLTNEKQLTKEADSILQKAYAKTFSREKVHNDVEFVIRLLSDRYNWSDRRIAKLGMKKATSNHTVKVIVKKSKQSEYDLTELESKAIQTRKPQEFVCEPSNIEYFHRGNTDNPCDDCIHKEDDF